MTLLGTCYLPEVGGETCFFWDEKEKAEIEGIFHVCFPCQVRRFCHLLKVRGLRFVRRLSGSDRRWDS